MKDTKDFFGPFVGDVFVRSCRSQAQINDADRSTFERHHPRYDYPVSF